MATIANEGRDLMAKALAGQSEYAISLAYLVFTNDSTAAPAESATDGHTAYAALDGVHLDFLRVPIAGSPIFAASSGDFQFNKATYLAISSGSTGVNGLAFGTSSKVVRVALVACPGTTQADDLVFVHENLDTPVAKVAGSQIAVQIPVTF